MKLKIDEKNIFNAASEKLDGYYHEARKLSWKYHGKQLKIYYPGKLFPSVSITGTSCAQNCLFCNKHYLEHMIHIADPETMKTFALKLAAKGGKGMLISGGYDEDSAIPLEPFLDVLSDIKNNTDLQLNVHTGLINKKQALAIKNAGIDVVSFDLVTDDEVIKEILQNNKRGKDYIDSFNALLQAGLKVIPHICLGLHYGTIKGNLEALKIALKANPELIVFLGLIPTKGTPMEDSATINPEILGKMLIYARLNNPQCEQSLGCMRVRLKEYEVKAIQAGINRIAVPKNNSLNLAEKLGFEIKRVDSCCAL
ncbi:MAG TPA: radical SAM protein [candidate division Zixibacteria bacterium]|nr:radical SAM protein [candidate division Zixibacteria bacterium]